MFSPFPPFQFDFFHLPLLDLTQPFRLGTPCSSSTSRCGTASGGSCRAMTCRPRRGRSSSRTTRLRYHVCHHGHGTTRHAPDMRGMTLTPNAHSHHHRHPGQVDWMCWWPIAWRKGMVGDLKVILKKVPMPWPLGCECACVRVRSQLTKMGERAGNRVCACAGQRHGRPGVPLPREGLGEGQEHGRPPVQIPHKHERARAHTHTRVAHIRLARIESWNRDETPLWLTFFPEGTDFNRVKHEKSIKVRWCHLSERDHTNVQRLCAHAPCV